eukprot:maker-scaffold12_size759060-snap-gene-2.13 protein:Tk05563 transcript:maker-scaffold12_size759060-snap-gene-2.13-mRNA-1 annotation:"single vwc domain protein 3"
MKSFGAVIFLTQAALVKFSWAAVALQKLEMHPAFPNQCYMPETNEVFDVGSSWPMRDQCGQMYCQMMGANLFVSHATCGVIDISGATNCVLKSDMSKPYPDCCPQPVCSEDINHIDDSALDTKEMLAFAEMLAEQDNDGLAHLTPAETTHDEQDFPGDYGDFAIQEAPIQDDDFATYDTSLGEAESYRNEGEQRIQPSAEFMASFPDWFYRPDELTAPSLPRK